MIATDTMPVLAQSDLELVSQCLDGNRDAFAQIVERYQNLICSMAYSATGNLSRSQELSQETFVIAWKQLPELREPGKLRSWLCAIARNRIYKTLGKQRREPISGAEPLDVAEELPSVEQLPSEQAISKEEEAILWRSLEKIPETYREPLILFYREQQSIAKVAIALDLSEEAVKQRLSRGRKLLHDQVTSFVESALKKTSPGNKFAVGVLAALPTAATSTKAATLGSAMAKSGAVTKTAAFGSLAGFLPMLGGAFLTLKAQADDTKGPRERELVLKMIGVRIVACAVLLAVLFGLGKTDCFRDRFSRDILNAAFLFGVAVTGTLSFTYGRRRQREIQMEEGTFVAEEWTTARRITNSSAKAPTNRSKPWQYMAFGLILSVLTILQAPWQEHLSEALLLVGLMALTFGWSYRAWQNRPRFQSMTSKWNLWMSGVPGLITLFAFNLHQYQAQTALAFSGPQSLATIVIFNLAVVLAYGAFIAIVAWRQRKAIS